MYARNRGVKNGAFFLISNDQWSFQQKAIFSPWCDSEPFILDVDNRSIVAIWIALFTSGFVSSREGFHMSCLSCSGLALWFIKGCGKTGSCVFTGIVTSGRKKNSDKTYPTSQETLWFPGKLVRIVPQRREEHSWSRDLSYFVKLWSKRWLVDGEAVLPLIPLPVRGSIPRNAPSRARVWLPPVFLSFFKLSKPNPLSTSNLALSSFTPIQLIVDTLLERHISSLWQWLVILGFDVRVLLDEGDNVGTGEGATEESEMIDVSTGHHIKPVHDQFWFSHRAALQSKGLTTISHGIDVKKKHLYGMENVCWRNAVVLLFIRYSDSGLNSRRKSRESWSRATGRQ